MRIVIVNPYFEPFMVGGAEFSLQALAGHLGRSGHEVSILANSYDGRRGTQDGDGFTVRWLACPIRATPGTWIEDAAYLHSAAYLQSVDGAVAELAADGGYKECLVIANNAQSWPAVAGTGSKHTRPRRVAIVRDAQAICEFGVCIESRSAATAVACSGLRKTLVCGARFVLDRGRVPWRSWPGVVANVVRASRRRAALRENLRRMDAIVTISEALRGLINRSCAIAEDRLLTIPNFASDQDPDAAGAHRVMERHGLRSGRYCLVAGKKSRGKGTDIAVRAIADPRLAGRDLRMVIAGHGAPCTGPGVVDLEHLPVGSLLGLLRSALALVVPGRCQEGLHRTMIDAVRFGVPVVCTEAGGVREGVEDGVSGRVVSCDSADALAGAIAEVAQWDEARRERCRVASARIFREKFDDDIIMRRWNGLLEEQSRERDD